jgi:hypothetical protein
MPGTRTHLLSFPANSSARVRAMILSTVVKLGVIMITLRGHRGGNDSQKLTRVSDSSQTFIEGGLLTPHEVHGSLVRAFDRCPDGSRRPGGE